MPTSDGRFFTVGDFAFSRQNPLAFCSYRLRTHSVLFHTLRLKSSRLKSKSWNRTCSVSIGEKPKL